MPSRPEQGARALAHDVIREDDLHEHGLALLEPYCCVMTGTHSEYPSKRMIDAFAAFHDQCGCFIYHGGNGFYWRTFYHPTLPGVIEMRRTEDGFRTWFAEGGEFYHAFTGEMGDMWPPDGSCAPVGGGRQDDGPGLRSFDMVSTTRGQP